MTDELMTTRELQAFLRVDRTTIYNMLNEGRLPGFKVGGQWRFSRREIEVWLREQREQVAKMPGPFSPDVLPSDCVQSVQSIFSHAMDVGSIITQLDGQPLTTINNSCAFCDLVLNSSKGFQRCMDSWKALATQKDREPKLHRCHAGLFYARGRIEVEEEFVAMVFAGQVTLEDDAHNDPGDVRELAIACGLDPSQLLDASSSVRVLIPEKAERLMHLLEDLGETLSGIGRGRLVLLRKLRHIAEVTSI